MYDNGPHIKDFIYAMPFDAITQTGMTYARFRTWRRKNRKINRKLFTLVPRSSNMALTPEYAENCSVCRGDRRNDVIAGDANADI